MNIQDKILMIIAFSLLVSAAANWVVLDQLAYPAFASLERKSATQNNQVVRAEINGEINNISITLWDYCNWDDAYEYAKYMNNSFAGENLNADNLSKFSIDWLEAYDEEKSLIFSTKISQKKYIPSSTIISLYPDIINSLKDDASENKGIISTPEGILMFAARPVLKTNGEGPRSGYFVFSRVLDQNVIDNIKQKTKINFDLIDITHEQPDLDSGFLDELVGSEIPVVTRDAQGDRLLTYSVLNDVMGAPVLVLRSTRARNISAIGRRVLLASMAGIAVSAMLVMGVTVLLLRWLLIKPLETFTDQVVNIGRTGELGQRVALGRSDEIGTLSREFGKMLERLENARDQSLERSYNTGLAEMAVGVLHNLRNHITPLSMQVSRLREHLLRFPGANVSLAYEELTTKCPDAERKQKLDQYIKLSLQDCRLRNEQIMQWLQRVADDLRHLDNTLSELERFGKSSNQYTPILVSKVVEEVIAQLPDYSASNTSIEISCHLASNVAVLSTPFILKHILHNLLVNACEAIVAANRPQGRIEVVQVLETSGDRNRVDLQVRDNGIGIAPDQLNTVFTRGFSTKIGERRGTGLHWCANSVAKMDGELFATSPGIDRGAVLHLLLPLAVADMHAAA